jgi:hypothetical protein
MVFLVIGLFLQGAGKAAPHCLACHSNHTRFHGGQGYDGPVPASIENVDNICPRLNEVEKREGDGRLFRRETGSQGLWLQIEKRQGMTPAVRLNEGGMREDGLAPHRPSSIGR